jgi:hypothetical protein
MIIDLSNPPLVGVVSIGVRKIEKGPFVILSDSEES